jgi:phage terminase small subunit
MTDQQELFVIEYVKLGCKNATQAAKNAGYSEKTARSQAQRLLTNVDIQQKLNDIKSQLTEELQNRFVVEASTAFDVLQKIMNDDNAKDSDRIKCATDVLDRAGFQATSRIDLEADISDSILHLEVVKASDDESTISN